MRADPMEQYEDHVMLSNRRVLIATSSQVMALDMSRLMKPQVLWAYAANAILSSYRSPQGVYLSIQSKMETPNAANTAAGVMTVHIACESQDDRTQDQVEALICHVVRQNNVYRQHTHHA